MARKSQQTILKRQREQKKAEKAARKRAQRDVRTDTLPASQGDDPLPSAGEEARDG
jgi:hypothetical protein